METEWWDEKNAMIKTKRETRRKLPVSEYKKWQARGEPEVRRCCYKNIDLPVRERKHFKEWPRKSLSKHCMKESMDDYRSRIRMEVLRATQGLPMRNGIYLMGSDD